MALIYISSTYKDLRKERQAAAEVVRGLGHQVILKEEEDFVAADIHPVDKLMQDVRSCDVYIGIFAWRYGFIPDGYEKSITHLEYEAARQRGIPCLIFLLDSKASWPVEFVTTGEGRKRIDQFRNELAKQHIINFFLNVDHLRSLVRLEVLNLRLSKEKLSPDSLKKHMPP